MWKADLMLQALFSHHFVVFIPYLEGNILNLIEEIYLEEQGYFLLGLHPSIVCVQASGLYYSSMAMIFGSESL
jgi:hypothetical protein